MRKSDSSKWELAVNPEPPLPDIQGYFVDHYFDDVPFRLERRIFYLVVAYGTRAQLDNPAFSLFDFLLGEQLWTQHQQLSVKPVRF